MPPADRLQSPLRSEDSRRMYLYLMLLVILATVGLQAWRILFDNFAVQQAGLEGVHIGIIQSVREIPGFLSLLAIYVMLIIREHRLSALAVLLLGCGLCAAGYSPSFHGLIFTTLIMSFGFHYFETTNQSLTLQYFDKNETPVVFGRLRSIAAASNIGIGIVLFLIAPHLSFKQIYWLVGGTIIVGALFCLTRDPTRQDLTPQRKHMVLRKRYWLFYFLTFMAGARRQIFIAFAVFLLVKNFHFSIQTIAVLFLVNNLINYFLSPMIGRAIVRFGEQKVLTLEYASLIVIFVMYAATESRWVVMGLYILDHVFFNFAIAIRTFFQKIAWQEDIAPSMAVGFTINHIAAVILPSIGGLLWMIDYRIPFWAGAVLSLISLAAVQLIPRELARQA